MLSSIPLVSEFLSYDWWRDIGVNAVAGVGSIAAATVAIVVAVQSNALARRALAAEARAIAAEIEPLMRARWVLELDATGRLQNRYLGHKGRRRMEEDRVILLENVGAGTAYSLEIQVGSGEFPDVWTPPHDARSGYRDLIAKEVAPPGGHIRVRWMTHLRETREENVALPDLRNIDPISSRESWPRERD